MPSEAVTDILEDLKAGVEASDAAAVKQAVDDLQAEYDRIAESEQVMLQRAVAARDRTSLSRERRQTLDSFARTTASVALPRSSILTFGAYYVTEPSQVDDDQLLDTADALADEEATLVEQAEQAEPVIEEADLPPALAFTTLTEPTDDQPKGSTFTVDATVRNVGDADAESVAVSAESDLPVSPESIDLGTLAPDASASATVEVSADAAGTTTVEFSADADDAEAVSESVEVTVVDKAGFVDRVRTDLNAAMQTLGEADLHRGTANGVEAKLEAAIRKVEDAEGFVERGKAKQADNALGAAANVLGAALNQLDAGRKGNGEGDGRGNGNGNGRGGGNGNGRGGGNGGGDDGTDDAGTPGVLFGTIETLIDQIAAARAAEL